MKPFAPGAFALLISLSAFGQNITFSEVNYNSDSTANSGNWVELLNYGSAAADLGNWKLKDANDLNSFTIPAGTIIQPGGRLVIAGDVARFTSMYPFTGNFIGPMGFGFSNDSDQVRLFDASGSLQLYMAYTDSTPWPAAADGTGRTLELSDPLADPGDPASWFVGCMFGSPGLPFSECNDPLVFSEINYNSDSLLDAGDWVEIHNHSAGYVNLTSYSFKDSNDGNHFDFPNNLQIAPGARMVLVHDPVRFQERHPNISNWLGPFDFNLSNDGELIRIFDHTGKLTYSVLFNDGGEWPELPDGDGYTLEFTDTTWNPNIPAAWFSGCTEGSPGYAYDPECNIGIGDILGLEGLVFFDANSQNIVIQNPSSFAQHVSVLNLHGQVFFAGTFYGSQMTIAAGSYPAGLYCIMVSDGPETRAGIIMVYR